MKKANVFSDRCCFYDFQEEANEIDNELRARLIPESEYQNEYNKEWGRKAPPIDKRFTSAGIPSKGKPECQPQEYDISEGILPSFSGESTAKSSYQPQPAVSKLKNFKPPTETKPPMLLGPKMMEVQPYSHWTHSPMPLELARKTAPAVPLWIREKLKPLEYETRYDLTTSYQADYCGVQTKPRRIIYRKLNPQESQIGDHPFDKDPLFPGHGQKQATDQDKRLWNYVHGLLYRTTTGSTYLPPSAFGEPMCHPTKYRSYAADDDNPEKLKGTTKRDVIKYETSVQK